MTEFSRNIISFSLVFFAFLVNGQENKSMLTNSAASGSESYKSQVFSQKFDLEQNSPNPFSNYTQIEYSNPIQGFVEFKVVNLIGKELFHRVFESETGKNIIRLDGEDFTPGVYIYSLSNGSQTITRRMVISKK